MMTMRECFEELKKSGIDEDILAVWYSITGYPGKPCCIRVFGLRPYWGNTWEEALAKYKTAGEASPPPDEEKGEEDGQ